MVDYYVACCGCGHPLVLRSVLGIIYVWDYKNWHDPMKSKCPKCGHSIKEREQ